MSKTRILSKKIPKQNTVGNFTNPSCSGICSINSYIIKRKYRLPPQCQQNHLCDKAPSSNYVVVFQLQSLPGLYTNIPDTKSYHPLLSTYCTPPTNKAPNLHTLQTTITSQIHIIQLKTTKSYYLSMQAAHKSLESSFSLIVLNRFFPSGGTGSSTTLPDLRASQNLHIQPPSGTSFNGGFRHFK
jgi:hypothetical protein